MVCGGRVGRFGGSLDDGVESEGGGYCDKGDVENFGGQAGEGLIFWKELNWEENIPITNDSDVVGFCCHGEVMLGF